MQTTSLYIIKQMYTTKYIYRKNRLHLHHFHLNNLRDCITSSVALNLHRVLVFTEAPIQGPMFPEMMISSSPKWKRGAKDSAVVAGLTRYQCLRTEYPAARTLFLSSFLKQKHLVGFSNTTPQKEIHLGLSLNCIRTNFL